MSKTSLKLKISVLDPRFRRLARNILKKLCIRNAHAAVFLLEGRKMAQIKRKYTGKKPHKTAKRPRGRPRPVDVLAFSEPVGFPHPETKKRPLGEIYINAGIAKRDPGRASRLLIHGLLHLLGYTHKGKNDRLRMQRKEAELLFANSKH